MILRSRQSKTGGAQEAQFTAWMDRFFAFVDGITTAATKCRSSCGISLRTPGASFWWAGVIEYAVTFSIWRRW